MKRHAWGTAADRRHRRLGSGLSSTHLVTFLAILLAALLLAGCASPRYATEVRYLPPTGAGGQACLQGCQTEMRACQADCQSRRQSCIATIEPRVDDAFDQALRQYEAERRVYMRERRFYQIDQSLSFGFHRHPFYYGYGYGYRDPFWYTDRYFDDPPVPPEAPSRTAIRERLVDQECNIDCGCQPAFDQCYIGCGGQVERRVVCVANCDDEAPTARIPANPGAGSSTGENP
ncbi:MAG: hypothetical protein JXJ30_08995 [Halothiobacillaceae bacterium]|nr:hypothetical protein [Halothiobacillaceae bacterium]HER35694.1 hypothetical protein [Halothiobacillaceae bacterium]